MEIREVEGGGGQDRFEGVLGDEDVLGDEGRPIKELNSENKAKEITNEIPTSSRRSSKLVSPNSAAMSMYPTLLLRDG